MSSYQFSADDPTPREKNTRLVREKHSTNNIPKVKYNGALAGLVWACFVILTPIAYISTGEWFRAGVCIVFLVIPLLTGILSGLATKDGTNWRFDEEDYEREDLFVERMTPSCGQQDTAPTAAQSLRSALQRTQQGR